MSCHTVGKHQPRGVAVNARGSDLLRIGSRVRHDWFVRWVRDPARIVPGMEMPAITMAIGGLLDDRLDYQLESLWHALNSPSFAVPSDRDSAQQIISLKPGDDPVVLRDVMFDCPPGSGWCARSFAIGLPNRHNVLFDLDTMSLRGWWLGDFARERTEGKTWLWEAGGLSAVQSPPKPVTVAMRNRETGDWLIPPGGTGDVLSIWRRNNDSVWFSHTFQLYDYKASVIETIMPLESGASGFVRRYEIITRAPRHDAFLLLPMLNPDGQETKFSEIGPLGAITIRSRPDAVWTSVIVNDAQHGNTKYRAIAGSYQPGERGLKVFTAELIYVTALPPTSPQANGTGAVPDSGPQPSARPETRGPQPMALGPGIQAMRLPLDPKVMPTSVSFLADSTPVVTSLKGQVFLAKDLDHDGIEDTWQAVSDHLAAPFGIFADGEDLLVCHKPELLRLGAKWLHGEVDYTSVVATGWGYTSDYHDWTFGPVRDSQGNLYISTASDYTHKDRPKQARRWRGRILQISPKGAITELARGARYPTGLAINRDDQVFFTDNQGVQNTFNEINHVVANSRYGVPALDDPSADQDPWPERVPAIKIPHPWTRSINGICFLDAAGKWGPFEGHGVGCEYDTRGLIRFSLQRVGDTYQGACYPFTLPEDQVPAEQRLLGPIGCAVSPNGDLYIGGLRDSGWGGGNNIGELARVRPIGAPPGIREVRAQPDGFVIDFTQPVDAQLASDPSKYTISSYRRVWQGTYATPDSDRRVEKIRTIEVAADQKLVALTLETMRPGYVYELHLGAIGLNSADLWPAEAYYTLNAVPEN
jgi:hypothetical protein